MLKSCTNRTNYHEATASSIWNWKISLPNSEAIFSWTPKEAYHHNHIPPQMLALGKRLPPRFHTTLPANAFQQQLAIILHTYRIRLHPTHKCSMLKTISKLHVHRSVVLQAIDSCCSDNDNRSFIWAGRRDLVQHKSCAAMPNYWIQWEVICTVDLPTRVL